MRCSLSLLLAALWLVACTDSNDKTVAGVSQGLKLGEKTWTRLYSEAPEKLRGALVLQGVDVTGSHHRLGFVDIYTSVAERDRILSEFASKIQSSKTLDTKVSAKALSQYRDPAEVSAFLDQVQADHPGLALKVDRTPSGLFEGQHVYAMKISANAGVDVDKPTMLFTSQIHAREVMTAEVTCDIIDYLTNNYGTDSDVTRWVDNMEIWVVPMINPDGANVVFSGDNMWRKNRRPNCPVDCNRNFPWNYRQCPGSDDYCDSDIYHGTGPASEPETQAIDALMNELRPMYYIDFHSYGEYILWSSGCGRVDEENLLSQMGSELNDILENDNGATGQWAIGNIADTLYQAPGGTEDHAYGAYGALGITIEMNQDGFQPDYDQMRNLTVQRLRVAWQFMLRRTLDRAAVTGHTFDANSSAPIQASYQFANHPFTSGQWPLTTDAMGRFGRAVLPNSEHVLVFTKTGYLPETRVVQVADAPLDMNVPMTQGTNHAPVVVSGPNQTVNEGDTVSLDSSDSSDPDGNTIFFRWSQSSGPEVMLRNAFSAHPAFFAPSVDADTDAVFQVVASDGELESAPATVTVTIRDLWNETTTYSSTDTPISIPDGNETGIYSTIHVADDAPILKAVVHVDITHTYIGDLLVDATSPSGTKVVLHDHAGGSDDNLHQDYQLPDVVGENAGGDWVLHVADTAGGDTGTLNSWSLALDLVGQPPCQSAGDCHLANVSVHDCVSGRCEIVTCATDYLDCNARAYDGCEINLTNDAAHCGDCATACVYANALGVCQNSACQMGACLTGYADCVGGPSDGCETHLPTDPFNCGGCGEVCAVPNAQAACVGSTCVVGTCDALWADCDSDHTTNGCESDVSTDNSNCGSCAHVCNLAHASSTCVTGVCQVVSCTSPYDNCDNNPGNGCEVNLQTNVNHCNACNQKCQAANARNTCVSGQCVMGNCLSGFGDCNTDSNDGCEINLRTDNANCGSCGKSCQQPNTQASCNSGSCVIASCDAGFADCNHRGDDGCEVDLNTDPVNCGQCAYVCQAANATAGCVAQQCAIASCDTGFGDCNFDVSDGCEASLVDDNFNCGECNLACNLPGATSECRSGACALLSCDSGRGNCDNNPDNGCEAVYASDANNCGVCGRVCSFGHAAAICLNSACQLGNCGAGFGNCNQQPSDGCEVNLLTDVQNCGSCGQACPVGNECSNGQCQVPCADKDGDGTTDAACGGQDCDDNNPQVHPGATETCNDIDDNCDGKTDEDLDCGGGGCGCATSAESSTGSALALLGLACVFGLARRRRS